MSTAEAGTSFRDRTAWARNLAAPVRDFLSNETGGAAVLLVATVAALLWANSPWSDSYDSLWTTRLSIQLGGGVWGAFIRLGLSQRFAWGRERSVGSRDLRS